MMIMTKVMTMMMTTMVMKSIDYDPDWLVSYNHLWTRMTCDADNSDAKDDNTADKDNDNDDNADSEKHRSDYDPDWLRAWPRQEAPVSSTHMTCV